MNRSSRRNDDELRLAATTSVCARLPGCRTRRRPGRHPPDRGRRQALTRPPPGLGWCGVRGAAQFHAGPSAAKHAFFTRSEDPIGRSAASTESVARPTRPPSTRRSAASNLHTHVAIARVVGREPRRRHRVDRRDPDTAILSDNPPSSRRDPPRGDPRRTGSLRRGDGRDTNRAIHSDKPSHPRHGRPAVRGERGSLNRRDKPPRW